MDDFLILVGLVVLAIPVAVIYLLVSHSRLKGQVRDLHEKIAALRDGTGTTPQPVSSAVVTPKPVTPTQKPVVSAELAKPKIVHSPADPPEQSGPTRPVVMHPDNFAKLIKWLGGNWFYVVSAVSLALAGIFLVQYGVETGLLSPTVRVLMALAFGAALIAGGEFIRRRFGDDDAATTAYLPSVFSSAGIITLFGSVLAARLLYDLIGPETALVGMVMVALAALVLGWFYGPLLAAVGIIGAFAAPFLVGGNADDVRWLYGYFLVIATLGLGIDTVRRWAWVTVITLVLAYLTGFMLLQRDTEASFALYVTALAVFSILIPARSIRPDHSGVMLSELIAKIHKSSWPAFPTSVAFGAVLVSTIGLVNISGNGDIAFWLAAGLLTALAVQIIFWSNDAPTLQDIAILPAVGFVGTVIWQGADRLAVRRAFEATYDTNPEAAFPLTVTILLVMAIAIAGAALWRALVSRGSQMRFSLIWAGIAAFWPTGTAIALELFWFPDRIIGAYPWALHAAALAALMVAFAGRIARVDGPDDRLRMSLPVLSALASLAFAFAILFTQAALTIALIVTVVVAAALDRMFRMPLMTAFITIGVAVTGYRLIADPGLDFAIDGPLFEVIVVFAGALAGFVAAIWLLTGLNRPTSKTILDSAAWAISGVFLSVLLLRWLITLPGDQEIAHWGFGLYAVIWLSLMAAQLRRIALGGWLRILRIGLSVVFALLGFGAVLVTLTVLNPLLFSWSGEVVGPPIFNTLAIAYLLPALVLLAAAFGVAQLNGFLRKAFIVIAIGLVSFWLFMLIRHFWQGSAGMMLSDGMSQPELYSYTVALLLVGAGLFYQSLAKRSDMMRRGGLAVIVLAVAKVFLVDAGELTGLTRVFSFLFLGLALAGLAWLGRWAQRSMTVPDESDGPDTERS